MQSSAPCLSKVMLHQTFGDLWSKKGVLHKLDDHSATTLAAATHAMKCSVWAKCEAD